MDMSRMKAEWVLGLVLMLAGAISGEVALGQGITKFAPDRPRLVLNPKGPTSDVRAMLLSPDGKRLYVAGLDKVVQVYEVAVDPASPGRDRLVAGTTLRWEVSRGTKGAINALAQSPDGKLLYVGGIAARSPYGRIAIFDPAQRQIVGALPLDVPTGDPRAMERLAHLEAVVSLSMSPDGKRLASASADGEVRVWPLDVPVPENGQTVSIVVRGKQIVAPGGVSLENTSEHRLLWVTNDRLVVTEREAPGRWVLVEYGIGAGKPQRQAVVSTVHAGGVTSLARSDDGLWASGERDGRVLLWTATKGFDQTPLAAPLVVKTTVKLVWPDGKVESRVVKAKSTPMGLSFGGGLLSVCVNYNIAEKQDGADREDSEIQVIRLRPFGLVATLPTSVFGRTFASVLSSDGGRLLSHISDADSDDPNADFQGRIEGTVDRARAIGDEVISFRLKAADGALRNEGEVSRTATTVRGRGLPVWHVAFPKKTGDYRIGFSQDGGDHVRQPGWIGRVRKEFDLVAGTLRPAANPDEWRQPVENTEGWRVEAASREVRLYRGAALVERLLFTDEIEKVSGRPYTVCLIPDEMGKPVALAVGTSTISGVFVYELPRGIGRRMTLVRYFRDHFGKVNSLCASADGRYLVSGSADQTFKVWSLSGLFAPVGAFPLSRAWGCTFQIEGGQLVVRNINPAGIASGRGFGDGDVITEVLDYRTRLKPVVESGAMLNLLSGGGASPETAIPTEVIVKVQAAGKALRQLAVVPAWEPFVTVYAEANGEWAAFTPQGYFNSSADEGPELFGWQINMGPATTPEFREGKDLAKEFERENLLKELLTQGTLGGAFQAVANAAPPGQTAPLKDILEVAVNEAPEVRITSPLDGADVADAEHVVVKAEVTLPKGADPKQFDIALSSNGTTLSTQQGEAKLGTDGKVVVEVTGTASPDTQLSRLRAFVGEKDSAPGFQADDVVRTRSQPKEFEEKYHLYFVGLACGAYPSPKQTGSMYEKLKYTENDVKRVFKAFNEAPSGQREYVFDPNGSIRTDGEVTPQRIAKLQEKVASDIAQLLKAGEEKQKAKVLLVIHIAGHGDVVNTKDNQQREQSRFYFVPTNDHSGSAEVFRTEDDVRKKGIKWTVFQEFARIPNCQKLFLVDACHSGAVVHEQEATKAQRRPLTQQDAIVYTATQGAGELAGEFAGLAGLGGEEGNGAFSFYLSEAIRGKVEGGSHIHDADGFDTDTEGAPTRTVEADGQLRLQEIERYVKYHTLLLTESSQTPRLGPKDLIEELHPKIMFLRGVRATAGDKETTAK
jgi:WD40 repeat protein